MQIPRFREIEYHVQGYKAGWWWVWDPSCCLLAFQTLKASKSPLDLSIFPTTFLLLLHSPATATGQLSETERLSSVCMITQHMKAVSARTPFFSP